MERSRQGAALGRSAVDAHLAHAGFLYRPADEALDVLLKRLLHSIGNVLVPIRDRLLAQPGLGAEQLDQLVGETLRVTPRPVMDICRIDSVLDAVLGRVYDSAHLGVKLRARRSIGRQAHDLVLAVVGFKSQILGEGRVHPAERMRHHDAADRADGISFAQPHHRAVLIARAVDGERDRPVIGGLHIGLERVHVVMAERVERREADVTVLPPPMTLVIFAHRLGIEAPQHAFLPADGLCIHRVTAVHVVVEGLHAAVPVSRHIPVDAHGLDVLEPRPGRIQAILQRAIRVNPWGVFEPDMPLLLRVGEDFAVVHDGHGRIPVPLEDSQEKTGLVGAPRKFVSHKSVQANRRAVTATVA